MFSTLPSAPILNASTGMSSSRQRAWSATQSASIGSTPSTPVVSCTVSAVTTESGWQPMLASVSRSACMPAPPDGSEAANVSTTGGDRDGFVGIMRSAEATGARHAHITRGAIGPLRLRGDARSRRCSGERAPRAAACTRGTCSPPRRACAGRCRAAPDAGSRCSATRRCRARRAPRCARTSRSRTASGPASFMPRLSTSPAVPLGSGTPTSGRPEADRGAPARRGTCARSARGRASARAARRPASGCAGTRAGTTRARRARAARRSPR